MASLLSHTKTLMPTSSSGPGSSSASAQLPPVVDGDDDDDEHDLAQAFVYTQSSSKDQISPQPSSNQGLHPLQYSARRRHVVKRTYDSSDDDENHEHLQTPGGKKGRGHHGKLDENKVSATDKPSTRSIAASLKRGLRNKFRSNKNATNAPNSNPDDVNSPANIDSHAHSRTPSPPPNAPTPPSSLPDSEHHAVQTMQIDDIDDYIDVTDDDDTRELTEEEREQLALEQSRLERESRRLRRKPDRSKHDDNRLLDIATRLSKLSSTLADNVSSRTGVTVNAKNGHYGVCALGNVPPKTPRNKPNSASVPPINKTLVDDDAGLPYKPPKSKISLSDDKNKGNIKDDQFDDLSVPPLLSAKALKDHNHHNNGSLKGLDISPLSDNNNNNNNNASRSTTFHPQPHTSSNMKAPASKHKKTWMASFQAVRSLGRSVLTEGLGRKPSGNNTNNSTNSSNHSTVSTSNLKPHGNNRESSSNVMPSGTNSSSSTSNVYKELGSRLNERGQKLQQTSQASEQMRNDAGDLAAAARALRQRQQNKGFFG